MEQKRLGWYNGGMSNHSSEEIRNQWEFGVRGPQPEARCVCLPELILMYKFHQYWTPKGNLGFQQSMDSRPLLLQVMQFFCETKTPKLSKAKALNICKTWLSRLSTEGCGYKAGRAMFLCSAPSENDDMQTLTSLVGCIPSKSWWTSHVSWKTKHLSSSFHD